MERSRLETAPSGRPRSAEAHEAILRAAIDVIRDVGYDAAAMDAIAARAGVGKATVYRRWSSKEALVADAIERIMVWHAVPDTGTTRGDLRAVLRDTMRMYHDPQTTALLSSLVAAMARSEQIAAAVRGGFVAVRRKTMRKVIELGIERGDLRKNTDVHLALDLLSGPLLLRALLTGAPIDERLVRGVADAVLAAFAP
jgi:AcrR family transcriptional regulator